jgi:AraC-like DNA-binding protein
MSRKRQSPADEEHYLIRTLDARFRDGASIAPHAHEWGQLIYAATGVMSVSTGQGSWVAPPHWAVWAPAGVSHAMRFTGETSLRTLYLRPGRWRQLPARSAVVTVSQLLRELIARAVQAGMLDERDPVHRAMAALIIDEFRTRSTPGLDLPFPTSPLLRRVADHLAQTPADRSAHHVVARHFAIGVRSLERGFEDETGMSLGRWRKQARLLFALRVLGAGGAVKQAALEAGYGSASAFIAAFRSILGTTPAQYFAASQMAGAFST